MSAKSIVKYIACISNSNITMNDSKLLLQIEIKLLSKKIQERKLK